MVRANPFLILFFVTFDTGLPLNKLGFLGLFKGLQFWLLDLAFAADQYERSKKQNEKQP
jgi:hypothetical protein